MTFFLDENFPRSTGSLLASYGHSALFCLNVFPSGTPDNELFKFAQQRHSVFLTTDKDFFHTIPWTFPEHAGAIVIALRQPNRQSIFERLKAALDLLVEKDLKDTVWLVTDSRIHSRRRRDK